MRIESRYQMSCGPDGEWRLRRENTRRAVGVYEAEVAPAAPAVKQIMPEVRVVTMGEPGPADRVMTQQPKQNRPISWIKRIVTARRLSKPESKSIAARGTI